MTDDRRSRPASTSEHPSPPTTPRWMVSSGQEVTVGDEVALEFHADEVGVITGVHPERGLPVVEIIEGPNRGKVRPLIFPAEILRKHVRG